MIHANFNFLERRRSNIYVLLLILATASYFDCRYGKIPNKLIMMGLLAAVVCRAAEFCEKVLILQESVQLADLSAYLWYPFLFVGLYFCFTVGGLGAGDVKLYMVSALFLRPEETMHFLLLSMGLALGMYLIRSLWKRTRYIRLAVPMVVSLGIMIVYRKAF